MNLRQTLLILAAAALAACSASKPDSLPDLRLPLLAGGTAPSLATCPTAKCLTVYVAPWCPYCRAATPMILSLRDYLAQRGVATRIVVGMADMRKVRGYAAVFGAKTLLDISGAYSVGGVPHFIVSDGSGRVLKDIPGAPAGSDDPAEIAALFGLP